MLVSPTDSSLQTDTSQITKSFVHHVQTSLARQPYNLGENFAFIQTPVICDQDALGAYQAATLSVRDNLIVRAFPSFKRIYSLFSQVNWNET